MRVVINLKSGDRLLIPAAKETADTAISGFLDWCAKPPLFGDRSNMVFTDRDGNRRVVLFSEVASILAES